MKELRRDPPRTRRDTIITLRSIAGRLALGRADRKLLEDTQKDALDVELAPLSTGPAAARADQLLSQSAVRNEESRPGNAEVARLAISAATIVGELVQATGQAGRGAPGAPVSEDWPAGLLMSAHCCLERGLRLAAAGQEGAQTALGAASAALDLFAYLNALTTAEDEGRA